MRSPVLLTAFALAVGARADLIDTFDTDAGGWQAANVDASMNVTYQKASWANGHVEATEFGSGLFLLAAPERYHGDLTSYIGGTTGFRLSDATSDGVAYPALVIQGAGTIMYARAPAPGTSLTPYSIPMTPSAWQVGLFATSDPAPTPAQFRAILGSVTQFGVDGDWTTNTIDRVALDDVHVAPVPEPATLAALGLGAVGLVRRRRSTR